MNLLLKKHWWILSVVLVLLLAVFLRFHKLGIVPHGMFWDEAAVGYNGYSIVTTRRDEWLQKFPVSFQSFGDYKAPLGIYINGIFTYFFGMNLWAVRLPFALSAIAGILGSILLAFEVFEKNKYRQYYSLLVGFLITTSPWHFQYSRTGFDSGLALTLVIWGLLFFIKALKSDFKKIWYSLAVSVCFSLGVYAYHSSKVVIPLLLVLFFVIFFKKIWKNARRTVLPGIVFVGLIIPLLKDSILGEGLARAQVTIFSEPITIYEKIILILKNYASHFSPNFLLLGESTTLRHSTGYMGVLLGTTFLLVILGFISFIKNRKDKYYQIFFCLIFIGLLPACIAFEIPHSSRSSLALPGFIFIAIYGLDYLIKKISKSKINMKVHGSYGEKNIIVKSVVGVILMAHVILSISFFNYYFSTYAKESADSFQDGYLEAFEIAQKYEKGLEGYPEVDKIIFTSDYGQPYIYALFVRKTNPVWYRGGSLIKYEFTEKIDINDLTRNNSLVVGSNADELPIENADHVIYGSDGKMRFQIFRTEQNQL